MKKFTPIDYKCNLCQSPISSSYSGQFVQCECGVSFVDQTSHYMRAGGHTVLDYRPIAKEIISKLENTKWVELNGKWKIEVRTEGGRKYFVLFSDEEGMLGIRKDLAGMLDGFFRNEVLLRYSGEN